MATSRLIIPLLKCSVNALVFVDVLMFGLLLSPIARYYQKSEAYGAYIGFMHLGWFMLSGVIVCALQLCVRLLQGSPKKTIAQKIFGEFWPHVGLITWIVCVTIISWTPDFAGYMSLMVSAYCGAGFWFWGSLPMLHADLKSENKDWKTEMVYMLNSAGSMVVYMISIWYVRRAVFDPDPPSVEDQSMTSYVHRYSQGTQVSTVYATPLVAIYLISSIFLVNQPEPLTPNKDQQNKVGTEVETKVVPKPGTEVETKARNKAGTKVDTWVKAEFCIRAVSLTMFSFVFFSPFCVIPTFVSSLDFPIVNVNEMTEQETCIRIASMLLATGGVVGSIWEFGFRVYETSSNGAKSRLVRWMATEFMMTTLLIVAYWLLHMIATNTELSDKMKYDTLYSSCFLLGFCLIPLFFQNVRFFTSCEEKSETRFEIMGVVFKMETQLGVMCVGLLPGVFILANCFFGNVFSAVDEEINFGTLFLALGSMSAVFMVLAIAAQSTRFYGMHPSKANQP